MPCFDMTKPRVTPRWLASTSQPSLTPATCHFETNDKQTSQHLNRNFSQRTKRVLHRRSHLTITLNFLPVVPSCQIFTDYS